MESNIENNKLYKFFKEQYPDFTPHEIFDEILLETKQLADILKLKLDWKALASLGLYLEATVVFNDRELGKYRYGVLDETTMVLVARWVETIQSVRRKIMKEFPNAVSPQSAVKEAILTGVGLEKIPGFLREAYSTDAEYKGVEKLVTTIKNIRAHFGVDIRCAKAIACGILSDD